MVHYNSYMISIVLLFLITTSAYADKGWLRVVASADYANAKTFSNYFRVGTGYQDQPNDAGAYFNPYELASKGGRITDNYSASDDFIVPAGKNVTKVMVAVQGGRSYSPSAPLNPSQMMICLLEHNATTDSPNHWRPAIKIFRFAAPIGGWHNMSFDELSNLPLGTSTGFVPGMLDWFELDVSDVNNGAGLMPGKYWLDFKTTVQYNSVFDQATNTWSSGNNYVISVSYGNIKTGPVTSVQGTNPGFGSRARIPYTIQSSGTYKSMYANEIDGILYTKYNATGSPSESTIWKQTTTCAYDTTNAGCDLSMLVFLWTDVTTADANWTQVPLPPPTCVRNAVPFPSTLVNAADKVKRPVFACPSPYYDYTDPSMAATPAGTVSSTASTPAKSTPTVSSRVPTPTNAAAPHVLTAWTMALSIFWVIARR